MAKRSNTIWRSKWVIWGLIPILLLGLWFAMTFWYIVKFDQSFLVLSYNHNKESFTQLTHDRLVKGEKLVGEFTAHEDNLGIVALRFKSFQRIPYKNEDTLVFRIKEKGQKDWYYVNQYRSGFVYDVPFLPFGFPLIADSQGKTYNFELESLNGNQVNGVALSTRQPFIASKYQFDKATLQRDYKALLEFSSKKFFNSFTTIDIGYSSFVFSLPLLLYLFWISPARRKVVEPAMTAFSNKVDIYGRKLLGEKYTYVENVSNGFVSYYLLIFILAIILIDIIILQIYNDLLYVVIAVIWFFLMKAHKLEGKSTIIIGLVLLILAPIYLQLNITNTAEKAGAWAFILICVGIFQILFELKKLND